MPFIVLLIGAILGVVAVLEILDEPITLMGKIITIFIVIGTNWIGILIYYLILRRNLYKWFR
ncbi:MAG: hypothetical protein IKS65_08990 [Bacteroidales bacterium]|nr:hypothetical protein [Bacteroidales bacterium]